MSDLGPPPNPSLPLFVYGALKPGMPAFERIRSLVDGAPEPASIGGGLFVRDGLPLVFLGEEGRTDGFLLRWQAGREAEAYSKVCSFEPRSHYRWKAVDSNGVLVNFLEGKHRTKGNPERLFSPGGGEASAWRIKDDPAFGEGMETVREVAKEIEEARLNEWQRFFRAQMAYLLLWSILERLATLSFGPMGDPYQKILRLHELSGMPALLLRHVQRTDRVSDSRDPNSVCKLDAADPRKCFGYYYQIRSNLSHRGKSVTSDFDKVHAALNELVEITKDYIAIMAERTDFA